VGSDTTQDVLNQFALDEGANEIGSWNAVDPVSQAIGETITPNNAAGGQCSFTRPDGSGQGLSALRKSINPNTTAAQLAIPPGPNCVDIARSFSGPSSNQSNTGTLVYIPFALDAVTDATGPTTKITTADDFTLTDLTNLYANCQTVTEGGVTYNPNTAGAGQVQIDLYVPQPGSGILSFWAGTLGFSATTLPSCVHQTVVGTTTLVEQNDGTAVATDPNGIMPFSVAQWLSQSNGHDDRRHGAVVNEIGGVFPCTGGAACPASGGTLNTAFPVTEEVYNILPYAKVVGASADPSLVQLFVGTSSLLCRDALTITAYGFARLNASTPDLCGATTNNLRAFDPTTNPV
jgi:phosphate transport system substrate-binding protein